MACAGHYLHVQDLSYSCLSCWIGWLDFSENYYYKSIIIINNMQACLNQQLYVKICAVFCKTKVELFGHSFIKLYLVQKKQNKTAYHYTYGEAWPWQQHATGLLLLLRNIEALGKIEGIMCSSKDQSILAVFLKQKLPDTHDGNLKYKVNNKYQCFKVA